MIWIRQVANLLGYGELQILEVFKNTLPTKLYWILFPIEDLRQAVDTAKRKLTKEKLDKQLTGQTSTSTFLSVRDGTDRRVLLNTKDELGDKIDKLRVMMSKLAAEDNHERKPFKPKYIKVEVRIDPMAREVTKMGQIIEVRDMLQMIVQNRIIEATDLEETPEDIVDRMIEEITGMKDIKNYNRDRSRPRERNFTRNYNNSRDRSLSNSRSRSGSRASTNRDRIRCYACRGYDHFMRDCTNSREERNLEQLYKILDMEEEVYRTESLDENHRSHLNL